MQQILLKNCTSSANQWVAARGGGVRGIALAGQRLRDLYTQISIVFNRNLAWKALALICIQSNNWRSLSMHSYLAGYNPLLAGAPARGKQVRGCAHPVVRVLPRQVHFAAFLVKSTYHLLAGAYSQRKEEPVSHQECRGYLIILRRFTML